MAGEATIEEAMLDITGHFLGTDEPAVEGGVIEGGAVRAAALGDGEPSPGEQLESGLFQAAFGQTEHQFGGFLTHWSMEEAHPPPRRKPYLAPAGGAQLGPSWASHLRDRRTRLPAAPGHSSAGLPRKTAVNPAFRLHR